MWRLKPADSNNLEFRRSDYLYLLETILVFIEQQQFGVNVMWRLEPTRPRIYFFEQEMKLFIKGMKRDAKKIQTPQVKNKKNIETNRR